ncbi:hypothetical protein GOBAR_AA29524 [Gossypium barbadense]|uniref:Uncharacterized protein n=1 Tax=Gossypium barbadense TaxID=3634 RepID=A0A2P5WJA2_GOSBA|nr:hypothetical protein GOBAR_AA29524 [Gossypium barbadense]
MEADKTLSPSSDRVNREGLQGPRDDNSSWPVGTETVNDGASVWDGCVLGGDLNKNTVGFCSILQERCVIHAAWFSTAGSLVETHPILEAGCVVPPGQRIPSGELGAGNLAWYTKKH